MALHKTPVLVFTEPDEVAALATLVYAGSKARRTSGAPHSLLQDRITTDIITAHRTMAEHGHEDGPINVTVTELHQGPMITTQQVAHLLGLSERQTRRLSDSLGAVKKAGVLHWPETLVHEYLEGKNNGK